jgi:hypothetical protein
MADRRQMKRSCLALAVVCGFVAVGLYVAAIWTSGDLSTRLGTTGLVSTFVATVALGAVFVLYGDGE